MGEGDRVNLFYSAVCRLRQSANRAARVWRPEQPSVEEGTGAVFSVAQILRSNRLRKPIVVSARSMHAVTERVLHALKENDLTQVVWEFPDRRLHAGDAEDLRMTWVSEACDSFIVIGDDSAIDFCKVAAALAAVRGRSFASLAGYDKIRRRLPPVIAVPIGPCAGKEALAWASLPDENGQRFVITDRALVPSFLVLDPELMEDVSRPRLAAASMDGLCLAVEAYVSGFSDDAARAEAADAVRGFISSLEPCWNSGGTASQKSALLSASRMAGDAASVAGPGYVRALVRGISDLTGAVPGELCAVLLPLVMEKYGSHVRNRLSELAEFCDIPAGDSRREKSEAFIVRLRQLAFRVGMPETPPPLDKDILRIIAEQAAQEANFRYPCPVVWTSNELAGVLRSAYEPK